MTKRANILLITADDMNWDAVGVYGCPVRDTTPNIDRLASKGVRFDYAHVTIAVCQPSRSVLMTGRYPHRNGGEGFFHLRQPNVPILPGLLRDAGYQIGILGKVEHSTPYGDFRWDMVYDMAELGMGRNPRIYGENAETFIHDASKSNRPFFLMANSHDPHRPFYGNDKAEWYEQKDLPSAVSPSRTFTSEEVTTPGFLPDLPDVRLEISEYYNSVRRCDDAVGELLRVLEETGTERNTMVIFLSDNGMAFPFSKTNCYLHSTRTPWIMRWPGQIEPGTVDSEHFISGIDLMPTVLDATGIDLAIEMDGFSFLPLLYKQRQREREMVFTQFHQTAARRNYPMRCVQTRRYGYIFNPWSNGERVFVNESQAGRTMKAMKVESENSPQIAERVNLFLHRVPEEFYDFQSDPDALHNLIGNSKYLEELHILQSELERWMEKTGDPVLEAFRNRHSRETLETFMKETALNLGGKS